MPMCWVVRSQPANNVAWHGARGREMHSKVSATLTCLEWQAVVSSLHSHPNVNNVLHMLLRRPQDMLIVSKLRDVALRTAYA